jgi:hypothetical protein
MSFALGYGGEVWSAGGHYFWIPMVAPFIGTTFGGWLYDMFLFTGKNITSKSTTRNQNSLTNFTQARAQSTLLGWD